MSLKEAINSHPTAATAGAVLILLMALGAILWQIGGSTGPRTEQMYYYDLDADLIFVDEWDRIPPIEAPSGAEAGVVAHIFACGECPDTAFNGFNRTQLEDTGAFIGYFTKYTEQSQTIQRRLRAGEEISVDEIDASEQWLVRHGNEDQWHYEQTEQALSIQEYPNRRCQQQTGERAQLCRP